MTIIEVVRLLQELEVTGKLRVLILARIVTAVILEVLQASATICLVEEPFNWATYYSLAISATD